MAKCPMTITNCEIRITENTCLFHLPQVKFKCQSDHLLSSLYHSKSASGTASASHSSSPLWPRVTPTSLPSETAGASASNKMRALRSGRVKGIRRRVDGLQRDRVCTGSTIMDIISYSGESVCCQVWRNGMKCSGFNLQQRSWTLSNRFYCSCLSKMWS